jgi:outer membrane lipoprotein SlyB
LLDNCLHGTIFQCALKIKNSGVELMKFHVVFIVMCLAVSVFFISGCSTPRPVLYPNAYLNKVGKARADKDVDAAVDKAKKYGLSATSHGQDAADTTSDTGVGAAAGAASGAVAGQTGTAVGVGAAAGAAGGAAAGGSRIFFRWLFGSSQPSESYRRFVNKTLTEKGYEVIGWE